MIKSSYSNKGKENLRKSLQVYIDQDAEWLYKYVLEAL
jgi:hypothetical protein